MCTYHKKNTSIYSCHGCCTRSLVAKKAAYFFLLCQHARCWETVLTFVNKNALSLQSRAKSLLRACAVSCVYLVLAAWKRTAMPLTATKRARPSQASGPHFPGAAGRHHSHSLRGELIIHEQIKHNFVGFVVSCQQKD